MLFPFIPTNSYFFFFIPLRVLRAKSYYAFCKIRNTNKETCSYFELNPRSIRILGTRLCRLMAQSSEVTIESLPTLFFGLQVIVRSLEVLAEGLCGIEHGIEGTARNIALNGADASC